MTESDMESEARPCTFCGVMLESALPDGDWSTYQPYGGGEVQFRFAFGSTKFDNNIGSTVFRGLICDECGQKFVHNMEISNGL